MGLASSQARLLSLTSRQHAVEARAQRLLSDKIRLSNDSDAAYQKYMNVLEDTALKTRQTNDVGETFWIDGNINNLMRYKAAENTGGSVFYVQDLETGKLYVPQEVFDNYNNLTAATVPAGHDYEDAMKFATLFGVEYVKVDENEDIKINYERAVAQGWNNSLTDAQYYQYSEALAKDDEVQSTAKILRALIPTTTEIETGKTAFKIPSSKVSVATNYETYVLRAIDSDVYDANDVALLQESLRLLKTINTPAEQDLRYKESVVETLEDGSTETNEYWATKTFTTNELKVNNGTDYLDFKDGTSDFTTDQKFEMMLNGGTITWDAKYDITFKNSFIERIYGNSLKNLPIVKTQDIYDSSTHTVLTQHGTTNMGDALTKLFDKMSNYTKNSDALLNAWGKGKNDVTNYRKFKQAANDYELYQPDYRYVPTNNVKATYYETLFNSIVSAGGCTGVNEDTAKNATWVENMIKNAKVILTTWDSEEMTLSRTSPSLHVDVKEITDDHRVAQAEQDYEAETAFINEKDTKIDNILNKLETERTTITTEIQGIEKVMKDNVSVNFKVFS